MTEVKLVTGRVTELDPKKKYLIVLKPKHANLLEGLRECFNSIGLKDFLLLALDHKDYRIIEINNKNKEK